MKIFSKVLLVTATLGLLAGPADADIAGAINMFSKSWRASAYDIVGHTWYQQFVTDSSTTTSVVLDSAKAGIMRIEMISLDYPQLGATPGTFQYEPLKIRFWVNGSSQTVFLPVDSSSVLPDSTAWAAGIWPPMTYEWNGFCDSAQTLQDATQGAEWILNVFGH
jgi:hypothetical protein